MNEQQYEIKISDSKTLQCSSTERQLAVATKQGIKLYCRSCGFSHLFTWSQLEQLANELTTK